MSYEQVIQQVKLEDLQDHEVHQALEQAISDFLGPAAKRLTIDGQVAEDLLNRHLLGPPKVAAALIRHAVVQNRRATGDLCTPSISPTSTLHLHHCNSLESSDSECSDSFDSECSFMPGCIDLTTCGVGSLTQSWRSVSSSPSGSPYGSGSLASSQTLSELSSHDSLDRMFSVGSLASNLDTTDPYSQHLLSDDDDSAPSASAMAWTLAFNDAQMESNFRSSLMYTRWAPTRAFNRCITLAIIIHCLAPLCCAALSDSVQRTEHVLLWTMHLAVAAAAVFMSWRGSRSWKTRTVMHAVMRVLRLVMTCYGATVLRYQDRTPTACLSPALQSMLHSVAEANMMPAHLAVDAICFLIAGLFYLPDYTTLPFAEQLNLAAPHGPWAFLLQAVIGIALPTIYLYHEERQLRQRFLRRFCSMGKGKGM